MTLQAPGSSLAGKTIVTVEDEGITQMQLCKLLTRAGLRVIGQASNGKEGLEMVLRERPDLVIQVGDAMKPSRCITDYLNHIRH